MLRWYRVVSSTPTWGTYEMSAIWRDSEDIYSLRVLLPLTQKRHSAHIDGDDRGELAGRGHSSGNPALR